MHYILRFGEISLKGRNRRKFEKRLKDNIDEMFPGCGFTKAGGRFYVEGPDGLDFRKVFGITSYSEAQICSLDYEEMEKKVLEMSKGMEGTFAIETQRVNKQFETSSMEMNRKLGSAVVKETGMGVDLDNPDHAIGVEIGFGNSYLFSEKIPCFGGIPVGIEGKINAWIEDEKSILAALLFMKRGCTVIPCGKEEKDISLLKAFGCKEEFKVKELQELEGVVVVGETLKNYKQHSLPLPLFRPLIGMDENEIQQKLEEYRGVL